MSETNGEQLPSGWAEAHLNNVAELIRGIAFPKQAKGHQSDANVVACLRTTNVQHQVEWSDLWWIPDKYVRRADQFVRPHDILISVANSYELVGKVALVAVPPVRSTLGAFIALIRAIAPTDPRYLYYVLSSPLVQAEIRKVASTTTNISNVNTTKVRAVRLNIAPSSEQTRIADALDELLSDLDAGVAALERAQAKLKHYRAAVLKAAVEGALTEEWREKHPGTEPASELLPRILAERRRRWEEARLQTFKQAGKEPPKNWKSKYKEPLAPDTANLPKLPERWCWSSLDQLCSEVRNGYSQKPDADSGVPILRISSVRPLALNLDDIRYLSGSASDYEGFLVTQGDLLFTRYNGTPSLVGVCAIVPAITRAIVHPDKLIRCRPILACLSPHYVAIASNVGSSRAFLSKRIRTTAGQAGVSGSDIKETPFPLAPLAEQEQIVEAVEDQISVIDHLEADLEAKLKSAQVLRQSILRYAFIGQLVPQDPNDEPAAELLKRIGAEREERARQAQATKQSKAKTKMSRNRPVRS